MNATTTTSAATASSEKYSKLLRSQFETYERFHRDGRNARLHFFGVPAFKLGLLGTLSRLVFMGGAGELIRLDAGLVIFGILIVVYLILDWKLTVPFSLFGLGAYFFSRALPLPVLILLAISGLVAQICGHQMFEKRPCGLAAHSWHFVLGPFYLFARLLKY